MEKEKILLNSQFLQKYISCSGEVVVYLKHLTNEFNGCATTDYYECYGEKRGLCYYYDDGSAIDGNEVNNIKSAYNECRNSCEGGYNG